MESGLEHPEMNDWNWCIEASIGLPYAPNLVAYVLHWAVGDRSKTLTYLKECAKAGLRPNVIIRTIGIANIKNMSESSVQEEGSHKDLEEQVRAVIASCPDPIYVREGNGAENIAASLAVTVAKLINKLQKAEEKICSKKESVFVVNPSTPPAGPST